MGHAPVVTHRIDHRPRLSTSGNIRLKPPSSTHSWRWSTQLDERAIDVVGYMNISRETGCLECGREPSVGPQEDKPDRGPLVRGQKRRGKQMNSRTALNPQICHVEYDRLNLSQ